MKGRRFLLKSLPVILGISLGLYACGGGGGGGTAQQTQPPQPPQPSQPSQPVAQKTLVAMYVVGSDLESRGNAATIDFKEIVDGLSGVNHDNLEIVIAFGGTDKEGWKGVKYMDKACLLQDIKDEIIGNDNCYKKVNPTANMGDPNTLKDFLEFIKNNYTGYDKKILIMWDHGASYLGFGGDENYNGDVLTLNELKQAFSSANVKFDLIGYDACLMASLEVAKIMAPYADYMVASEELEPGHGWYYTPVIKYIAQNPNAGVVNIAKNIVDSYMNHPYADKGKTLSVIDLSKINNVITALDNLLVSFENLEVSEAIAIFGESFADARFFGVDIKTGSLIPYTMDLKDFALKVKENNPSLRDASDKLISAVDEAVIYAKHDGSRPGSYGLSIFNPGNAEVFGDKYTSDISPSDTWYNGLHEFYTQLAADGQPPQILEANCPPEYANRLCIHVTDDIAVQEVNALFLYQYGNRFYMVGSLELEEVDDGIYVVPDWNGEWVVLYDRTTDTPVLFPLFFYTETGEENSVYVSPVILNGNRGLLLTEVNERTQEVISAYFASISEEGSVSKVFEVEEGDTIQFVYFYVDDQGNVYEEYREQIQITQNVEFIFINLAEEGLIPIVMIYAEDFSGNDRIIRVP